MPAEECVQQCVSVAHGNKISSALTKRAVTDSELCAYLNSVCEFCGSSRDGGGKMALHMAASCGRTDVCKWLICQKQARIDERDRESGYTALHRSIFYGRIDTSVALIKLGANMNLLDNNDLTPLDHAAEDNLIAQNSRVVSTLAEQFEKRYIYAWGSNSNYTLGPMQARNTPEILDIFHQKYKYNENNVIQVCLEKFHTVILTKVGEVFTYGLGQGGRLGLNTEKTIVEPSLVNFITPGGKFLQVIQVTAARDHTMFLLENGNVYVCGLNTHHVLGSKKPLPQSLVPKIIPYFQHKIIGICCGRFHSVAWSKQILYTWGLNAGQLGFAKGLDNHIISPRSVPNVSVTESNEIVSVAASDGATAVATIKGDIYILHEYQCRKIASRLLNIKSLAIIGGTLDIPNNKIEFTKRELKVVVLTQTGTLFIWQESDPQLNRCIFPLHRLLEIKEVRLHYDGLFLLTKAREVFHGKIKPRKKTMLQEKQKKETPEKCKIFHKFLDKTDCVLIQLIRVNKLYAVDSICCDPKGENFAVLNINTACFIEKMTYYSPNMIVDDFRDILLKPDVADVTFRIGNSTFPAHKFIIASRSEKLKKQIDDTIGSDVIIENVQPEIFEQLLQYIYTSRCDLLNGGTKCPPNLLKYCVNTKKPKKTKETTEGNNKSAYEVYKEKNKNKKDDIVTGPIRLLQEAAKRMGVNTLFKALNGYTIVDEMVTSKRSSWWEMLTFEMNSFPDYYDVAIISKNGKAIDAHKCVLAARCEFFDNMFSTRWNESEKKSEISLPFPQNTITHLLSYLYSDNTYILHEDLDGLINLLVLSDHLLIPRLLNVCELYIAKCISMKTVIKILSVSHCYNAKQLKQCAMEYIFLNLPLCFETRILEQVEPEILKDLTTFYAEHNKKMSCRVITPFSDAVNDDNIKKISTEHPINMNFEEEIVKVTKEKPQRKRNRSHKLSISDRTDSCKENIPIESSSSSSILCEELATSTPKSIPTRIQSILLAHEKLEQNVCEEDNANYVSLKLISPNQSYKDDFPDLNNSYTSPDSYSKSPNKGDRFDKHKMQKISQKQRKRLLSENSLKEMEKEIVPEAPRNPWKIVDLTSPQGSPDTNVNITNIITEEKKQKENLSKIKCKKLINTQIEDKAIEELHKFYNVDNVFDELVFIERVEIGVVATPVWVQK